MPTQTFFNSENIYEIVNILNNAQHNLPTPHIFNIVESGDTQTTQTLQQTNHTQQQVNQNFLQTLQHFIEEIHATKEIYAELEIWLTTHSTNLQ